MKNGLVHIIPRIVLGLAVAAGTYYVLVFLILAFFRVPFPFDLDWLEGCVVDHVQRILQGAPIYVRPSIDFVPFLYPPFYYYVSAVPAWFFGVGHFPLRLVSALSTVGCFAILYVMVKRQTQSRAGGMLAAGFFASSFSLNGFWFDAARVDMLAVFLCLAAIYLVRFHQTIRANLLAGVLLFLAVFTKQTMVAMLVPLAAYTAVKQRIRSLYFIGAAVALMVLGVKGMDHVNDGWFSYYVLHLPSEHELITSRILTFWTRELLFPLALMVPLAIVYFYKCTRGKKWDDLFFYGLLFFSLTTLSCIARLKEGSSVNSLIPLHIGFSLIAGMAMAFVLDRKDQGGQRGSFVAIILLSILCLAHFGRVFYNPATCLPPERGRRAGEELLLRIGEVDGNVWVMDAGSYTARVNKKGAAHIYAVNDVLSDETMRDALKEEFLKPIRNREFGAVVMNPAKALAELEKYYRLTDPDLEIILRQAHGVWLYRKEALFVPVE